MNAISTNEFSTAPIYKLLAIQSSVSRSAQTISAKTNCHQSRVLGALKYCSISASVSTPQLASVGPKTQTQNGNCSINTGVFACPIYIKATIGA